MSKKSSENNTNKRFKYCIISIVIIFIISSLIMYLSFRYFDNSKKLSSYSDMSKGSIESFYNDITTNAIDKINSVITVLAVIATVFAAFGVSISLINIDAFREIYTKSNEIDKKIMEMNTKSNEIDKKMLKINEDIQNLKVMQHLVLGKMYENLTGNANYRKYAIKEYEEGGKLPNSGIITIQLINIYSDLFIKTKKERYLDVAKKYAEQKCQETNNLILGDLYFAKGCLYGLIAKYKGKLGYEDESNNYFKRSKENFQNAILEDKDNYQFYTNLAVTCFYLSEDTNVIDSLEDARKYVNNDKMLYKQDIDVFDVFDLDEMEKMGYEKWKYYKEKVGIKNIDIEDEFNKKVKEKNDLKEECDEKGEKQHRYITI